VSAIILDSVREIERGSKNGIDGKDRQTRIIRRCLQVFLNRTKSTSR
jgi:hypothetical protein